MGELAEISTYAKQQILHRVHPRPYNGFKAKCTPSNEYEASTCLGMGHNYIGNDVDHDQGYS